MTGTVTAADVMEAFSERGFEYIGKTESNWYRLRGQLIPPQSNDNGCACEVHLDPTFFELPRIKLLEFPPSWPDAVPHLGANGELCYLAKGAIVVDIFDPLGQSLAFVDRAAYVFGQILKGEMVEDLAEEFFAYWSGWPCLVDMQGNDLGQQQCIVAKANGTQVGFITDNEERTTKKLTALGCDVSDLTVLTYRVKTCAQPHPLTSNWPPRTVREILSWQRTLDRGCSRKIHQRITEGERKKANGILIIVESPALTYGFAVFYDRQSRDRRSRLTRLKDPTYQLEVMPVSVIRIDDRYLAQRNIPTRKTLAGINIAIIGCGTIGGYLSEMLVKAGAGTSGGQITLVDFDSLLPQNVGRHRLGFPDLLSNKAIAMANELKRIAPGIAVRALPVDVKQAHLGELDLLIDATGEEALGHWLCANYHSCVTMLTVWIEGPGTAVRALLSTNDRACCRCLWHSNKRGEQLSVVGSIPVVMAGHGCEGLYVPFPATVSVQAASLGAEMVLDWVNDIHSPTLRTRLIDHSRQLATPDCDPSRDRECPICNS